MTDPTIEYQVRLILEIVGSYRVFQYFEILVYDIMLCVSSTATINCLNLTEIVPGVCL